LVGPGEKIYNKERWQKRKHQRKVAEKNKPPQPPVMSRGHFFIL
jgi:hypothetical protein